MRLVLAAILAFLPLAAHAAPGPSFDCAKASQPVEKAICADDSLAAMDRLLDRAYKLALDGLSADRASALKGDQVRWLLERARSFKEANGEPAALAAFYDRRLRAVIAKAGPRILPTALERARPIDPLADADPEAEAETAFVAYVLTTLNPDPDVPDAGGEPEVLSPFDLYGGFSYAAALPDGRLLMWVAEICGAYQCTLTPFLLDKEKGTAARLAMEFVQDGKRHVEPRAVATGLPSVRGGAVEVFEQWRGLGDCGVKRRYRVDGTTLALVEAVEKPDCDGKDWSRAKVTTYARRN